MLASDSPQHQQPYMLVNDENNYELSETLVERRKRLHELAVEINQWEDDTKS